MKYAVKISELNLNKFVDNLSKLVKKSVEEGQDPQNTLIVVDLMNISCDIQLSNENRAITAKL